MIGPQPPDVPPSPVVGVVAGELVELEPPVEPPPLVPVRRRATARAGPHATVARGLSTCPRGHLEFSAAGAPASARGNHCTSCGPPPLER